MNEKKLLKRKIPALALIALLLLVAMLFSLSGCADTQPSTSATSHKKMTVVATTTMLADLAQNIGGGMVQVEYLMGPGIDPHLYQASAGDVTKMQNADVIVYNGLHLEGKMGDVLDSLSSSGKSVVCIEQGLDETKLLMDEGDLSVPDPHIWFDVDLWKDAATHLAAELATIDASHATNYEASLQSYLNQLDELDAYIRGRAEELPQQQRVLVTAHDAFRYFGRAYGFEVKGLQGISTDAEAGTADVSILADFIAERQIGAIFIESSVPAKNVEALQAAVQSRGFDVQIGGELYSDSLGDKASGTETYINTCRANIDTIVNALL